MKNSLEGKQYTSTIFLIKQIEVMKIINFIKKGRQTAEVGPSQQYEGEISSLDSYVQPSTSLVEPSSDFSNNKRDINVSGESEIQVPGHEKRAYEGYADFSEDPNVKKRKAAILKIREISASNLTKQAEKMLQTSNSKYPAAKKGDTEFESQMSTDGRNILAIVLEITDDNLYKLGTKHGILNQLYARNQFTICNEKFIIAEEIPSSEISLRKCSRMSSKTGGQGYSRFGCKGGCKSDKCKCRKEKSFVTRNVTKVKAVLINRSSRI
ncbi:unnamed protein product [Psylliodes chrysocephalus]|uniref:Uncharacterized protein n=1 Tax=Psylliodes chrysocephalus TaxID=3402493 RepID=A0A9P0GC69_9CUCU|nr:unnamed protein product [Psylliodes chrysocephala]